MPPSKHSGSSRSAHKDSDQIPKDQNYALGEYSFRIERSSVPGSTNDKIEAICTKDGKNARKSIQVPSSTKIKDWCVEANSTEASVYVTVIKAKKRLTTGELNYKDFNGTTTLANGDQLEVSVETRTTVVGSTFIWGAESDGDTLWMRSRGWGIGGYYNAFTYDGKTVYYGYDNGHSVSWTWTPEEFGIPNSYVTPTNPAYVAWDLIYGEEEEKEETILVARFAIELNDAGGGPDNPGGWVDPGDWEDGWEEGDPTHTLYVTVTGALSGRHNDPIEDPSYSYIPADKDTVKDYGCGGDGGHGGGGGAGASTVVIHKFATNQANSKEVTAIARRHGYGSGGGKGGKGGDGCILVYY